MPYSDKLVVMTKNRSRLWFGNLPAVVSPACWNDYTQLLRMFKRK